jgi:filamentous hemagglutinin family protein
MQRFKLQLWAPIIILPFITELQALPTGTESVLGNGSFSISQDGSQMNITAPDGSIFNHDAFNIAAGETVQFIQPSAQARVLNRILSSDVSTINGSLLANGEVFFASPAGLFFGETAVVDVGLLHVIGGQISDENFLSQTYNYESLVGTIENHGLIIARDIIFAGQKVVNSGQLRATEGEVSLLAGDSVILNSVDGSLSVDLTQSELTGTSVASDLAGQAVLQSGIINAQRVRLSASSISHSGSIDAQSVEFTNFSSLDASSGEIKSEQSILIPRDDIYGTGSEVMLSSSSNQLGNVSAQGPFANFKIRSNGSLEVIPSNSDSLSVQNADIKTSGGVMKLPSFSPIFTSSPSEFLVATDAEIILEDPESLFSYNQVVLFGTNMDSDTIAVTEEFQNNWHYLSSESLNIDDLQAGLSPQSILTLSAENQTFSGFSDGIAGRVGPTNEQPTGSSNIPDIPMQPSGEIPDVSYSDSVGGMPGFSPAETDHSNYNQEQGGLSLSQLEVAMKYGLFSNYSYVIKRLEKVTPIEQEETTIEIISEFEKLENLFTETGGVSSLFGGSFDVVQSSSESSSSSSTSDSNSESGDSQEEASDDDSASSGTTETSGSDKSGNGRIAQLKAIGAAPFAPIGMPVLSPNAAQVLETALSQEIEMNLQKFTDR